MKTFLLSLTLPLLAILAWATCAAPAAAAQIARNGRLLITVVAFT